MGFKGFLGNERLLENLRQALKTGRTSHFYVISGPKGSGKHTLARLLSAALLCQEPNKPCLTCRHCRKVLSGAHPDVILVDDPEKKTVPVELMRQMRSDLFVRPNEAARKIYILPRGQDMGLPGNSPAQNALLKVLEEPPSYGVFLLLTENPERLLPTVRSRCAELSLRPLEEKLLLQQLQSRFPQASSQQLRAAAARSGGYLGQAMELVEKGQDLSQTTLSFADAFGKKDVYGLLQTLVPMEKWKRDQLILELNRWVELLTQALESRCGIPGSGETAVLLGKSRSSRDLMAAVKSLKTAIDYAQGNVSVAAICGALAWDLR